MRVDLSCPVEFERWERVAGNTRGQAYLYFLNMDEKPLDGMTVKLRFLDRLGVTLMERSLEFSLEAPGREHFVVRFLTDHYPAFHELEVMPERLRAKGESVWELREDQVRELSFEPLPPGPKRVALVALAGPDAVCFPQEKDGLWRCVCGRFQTETDGQCRRCGRGKQAVMEAYGAEDIEQRYTVLLQQRLARDQAKRDEELRKAAKEAARLMFLHKRAKRLRQLTIGLVILALAVIAIFLLR